MKRQLVSGYISGLMDFFNIVKEAYATPQAFQLAVPRFTERNLRDAWSQLASAWTGSINVVHSLLDFAAVFSSLDLNAEQPTHRILSIGSGPGLCEIGLAGIISKGLTKSQPELICVDNAFGMSNITHTLVKEGEFPNLRVITGDAQSLPIARGVADQVICIDALQSIPRWEQAIDEISLALKPTGRRRACFVVKYTLREYQVGQPAKFWESESPHHINALRARELEAYLSCRRYRIIGSRPINMIVDNVEMTTGHLIVAEHLGFRPTYQPKF